MWRSCRMLWGVGGLTFGLAIRYLACAWLRNRAWPVHRLGTLVPPCFMARSSRSRMSARPDHPARILACLCGRGKRRGGLSKEHEDNAGRKGRGGRAGLLVCEGRAYRRRRRLHELILCLRPGRRAPIGAIAKAHSSKKEGLSCFRTFPVLVVVLWGGFATNFIWSVILISEPLDRTVHRIAGRQPHARGRDDGRHACGSRPNRHNSVSRLSHPTLVRNYLFAGNGRGLWYLQFSSTPWPDQDGQVDFSSWTLHMASISSLRRCGGSS